MSIERVRERYREVNGDHPMSPEDDWLCPRALRRGARRRRHVRPDGGRPAAAAVVPARRRHPDGAGRLPRARRVGRWPRPAPRRGSSTTGPGDAQDTAEEEWAAYLLGAVRLPQVGHPGDHPPQDRAGRAGQGRRRRARAGAARRHRPRLARGGDLDARRPRAADDRLRPAPVRRPALARDLDRGAPRDRFLTPVDPPLPLRTERLVLRQTEPGDAESLFAYYSDPDVMLYLLTPPLDRRRGRGRDPAPGDPARRRRAEGRS